MRSPDVEKSTTQRARVRAAWWWIDRWRKSTAYTDMTLAEQGAYRNLLDELWLRDGLLPLDERVLAKISGDALEWPKVRERVIARFIKTATGYRNETHDEVSAWPAAQAEKGKKRAAGAARTGGRFTSPPPAGPPAESQPEPPAHHQPPSPSPSPSPSPTNGNGRRTSVAVAPAPWSAEACEDWSARFNGTAPGGIIGKSLKPLVTAHGWPEVRAAWQNYLGQTEAEYASASRFAQTYGRWSGTIPAPAGKESLEEHNRRVIAAYRRPGEES